MTVCMDIYIVERSAAVRRRLASLIEGSADLRVCGLADSEERAVRDIVDRHPDAVIVDLHLAAGGGIRCVRRLRRAGIASPIVLMSDDTSAISRRCGIECGADGLFDKRSQCAQAFRLLRQLAGRRGAQPARRPSC